MSEALGTKNTLFNPHTGDQIPLRTVAVEGPGGSVVQQVSMENCMTRLTNWRQMAGERVAEARAHRVEVPRFDPRTGEPIPNDSLRALEATMPGRIQKIEMSAPSRQVETEEQRRQRERAEDEADLELGLHALQRMKEMKAPKRGNS